ncbi:hypothetical protein SIN8267_01176 [Sinobacterium norvegicum]|uniref:Uncharacterized protein n=1 Tax=Sinobacterium norvegicum TaxID=1641715 RepID=A0ABN8EHB5_9GAMM|nr:hypothetical protein [Sinobacterium norvegicum]CAH0991075.1 hypothetical protein SIN8267_01176 [Sinobacterium norvegicum]
MEKTPKIPLWVFLAFNAIESRKGALILITCCALFAVLCIPLVNVPLSQAVGIPADYQLQDDWSWFLMMLPMTAWYVAALWWSDKNDAWSVDDQSEAVAAES